MTSRLSRRSLLKGSAALGGAFAASRLLRPFSARADATEKSAVMLVFLDGGYNALFSSPDSFLTAGDFGVTSSNILSLGNGLFVDAPTFGTLPPAALGHIACIGVNHGIDDHDPAKDKEWGADTNNALKLAAALGGDASIQCAVVGGDTTNGSQMPVSGVSFQQVLDTGDTLAALGATVDPTMPNRAIAADAIAQSQILSAPQLSESASSLRTLANGYAAAVATLKKPVQAPDVNAIATAYGFTGADQSVDSFASKMYAAELMIRTGTNVVVAIDGGWDSHGDSDGSSVRTQMQQSILPGLSTFLSRTLAMADYNVVTAIFGDFARSLPGSDHANCTVATVFGKYVKVGTTGRVDASVMLPQGSPSVDAFWAYLGAAAKVPNAGFGPNPHPLLTI